MLIGRLSGAFGVRGELKVEPMTDFPERFEGLESIYLGDEHVPKTVLSARTKGRVLLMLEGIDSREQAQALRGKTLWVPRTEAVELPEGQYYRDEIVGLTIQDEDGAVIGTIEDILETGANDVYVVKAPDRQILVPAIRDVVVAIEPDAGRVVIRPMPGMLD